MIQFWQNPEKMQQAIFQSSESVRDMVWAQCDGRLVHPLDSKDRADRLLDLMSMFECGFKAGAPLMRDCDPFKRLFGVDTGAEYIALFIGSEEEVIVRLRACGVVL